MKKNIVILGSSSFIGKNLEEKLKGEYYVNSFNSKECNLLEYINLEKKLRNLREIHSIIICSAITRLIDNSLNSYEKNISMAINISKFLSNHPYKIKQLIFLSTIDVYGTKVKEKYHEKLPIKPQDYYSLSKVHSEQILEQVCSKQKIKLFIPRLPGIFGNYDNKKSTINHIVKSALSNTITLYNNGNDLRDFIHIDYLVHILNNAIKKEYSGILNIATGTSHSIKEISIIIKDILKSDIIFQSIEKKNIRASNIEFDITKLLNSNLISDTYNKDINYFIKKYLKDNL
ncbi:NAD-dependent epimerase/dehydratase family protein [Aliarcobacter cryaerophilus]|uniref:NAD-dependent epimerase/dehydratase family protein n=1 Tax=Aliarcobacter cryaerophilus TaxID=28198 RepID=UPI00082AB48C|nr:SDR family oxidoreductase [Aliarcobacter cryaerophilus]